MEGEICGIFSAKLLRSLLNPFSARIHNSRPAVPGNSRKILRQLQTGTRWRTSHEVCEIEGCLTDSSITRVIVAPTMKDQFQAWEQRLVRYVTVQFNLSNEPWIKYGLELVADKGLKKATMTCARLKKGEVIYMETHFHRYELCYAGEKLVKVESILHADGSDGGNNNAVDVFRFSRCKRNLPQSLMQSLGIPLSLYQLEVLEENLDWEDIIWSTTGVWIGGKEYQLARLHFMAPVSASR